MNPFATILLAGLSFVCMEAAEPRIQGRSLVISKTGIVATEQVLASQVGAQILADGGNAADAAVAANAMMGLVSPGMCGIGGDMFCLVYDAKSGRTYGLAANGWSPQKLTPVGAVWTGLFHGTKKIKAPPGSPLTPGNL